MNIQTSRENLLLAEEHQSFQKNRRMLLNRLTDTDEAPADRAWLQVDVAWGLTFGDLPLKVVIVASLSGADAADPLLRVVEPS